jgi:integrase
VGLARSRPCRKHKAADLADGTWPNLIGHFKPHDGRHTHATWLDDTCLSKVIQMDRRGHVLQGIDRVYTHVTLQMRQRLCDILEDLWQDALAQRRATALHSAICVLYRILRTNQEP